LINSLLRYSNLIGRILVDQEGNPISEDVIDKDHTIFRIRNGKLSSEDRAPAIICIDGHIEYWRDGQPYRAKGNVAIEPDGRGSTEDEIRGNSALLNRGQYKKLIQHFDYYEWYAKEVRSAYMQSHLFFQNEVYFSEVEPYDPVSFTAYDDLARFILYLESFHHGFTSREWYTPHQIHESRWKLKSGARGTAVPKIAMHDGRNVHSYEILFNREQLETYSGKPRYAPERFSVDSVFNAHPFILREYEHKVSTYDVLTDTISMPEKRSYKRVEEYYSNLMYELVRWTGHPDRLNRPSVGDMHQPRRYAVECMIADIGAHDILKLIGLKYFGARRGDEVGIKRLWYDYLRTEPRLLFYAITQASLSVHYLLRPLREGVL
jgi:antirestriction protein ArdC